MTKYKTGRQKFKMQSGSTPPIKTLDPAIFIIGTGRATYIWVGNDSEISKLCFATMSGPKTLEKFAVNILRALKSKHLKQRP